MNIEKYQGDIMSKRQEGIAALTGSLVDFFMKYSVKFGLPGLDKPADVDIFFGSKKDWKDAFYKLDLSRDEVYKIVKNALAQAGERLSPKEQK